MSGLRAEEYSEKLRQRLEHFDARRAVCRYCERPCPAKVGRPDGVACCRECSQEGTLHRPCECDPCSFLAALKGGDLGWIRQVGWIGDVTTFRDLKGRRSHSRPPSYSTFGLMELYGHRDVEVLGDREPEVMQAAIAFFADKVVRGEQLHPGKAELPLVGDKGRVKVSLVRAVSGDGRKRKVMRVILPPQERRQKPFAGSGYAQPAPSFTKDHPLHPDHPRHRPR